MAVATQKISQSSKKSPLVKNPTPPRATPSKVDSGEWWLIIGILGFIDLIQIFLEPFIIANNFIDIGVAILLIFYLTLRGELSYPPTRTRAFVALAIAILGENIPILNAAPFWIGDGFYFRHLSKQRNASYKAEKQRYVEEKQQAISAIEIRQKIEALQAKKAAQELEQMISEEEDEVL